jgi:uncharacterized protein
MRMRSFGRRSFVVGGLGLVGGIAIPVRSLAQFHRPQREALTVRLPGLDPAHDGLRIAQLSDLHVGRQTPDDLVRAAVAEANALGPDLVVLTGDYVCMDRRDVGLARELLAGLAAPTYAVLGNHDVWTDPRGVTSALRSLGYQVLENAWTAVRARGAPLHLVGVGDRITGHEDVGRALSGLPPDAAPLVLAHAPRTADRLRALDRQLVCLSGHTHGGQISVPLLTPLLLAGMAREPYVRGRYRLGGVQLYVNRGVGNSGVVPMRVNSPPEVTLVTLRAA